jgi:hypothetical protein
MCLRQVRNHARAQLSHLPVQSLDLVATGSYHGTCGQSD